jgi:hypothetical protein
MVIVPYVIVTSNAIFSVDFLMTVTLTTQVEYHDYGQQWAFIFFILNIFIAFRISTHKYRD